DLRHGSGRNEAIILVAALNAEGDEFREIVELAGASFSTQELALESLSQGKAFLQMVQKAWPHEELNCLPGPPTLAIALAIACKAHGIGTEASLHLHLQAWLANLISAAVRLAPIGQTDAQIAQAELEDVVIEVAAMAMKASIEDLGSAAVMVDWTSMQHETQYTRLFRS
ncbi:MAG: urease accessory protein UreF, partial [Alphaproteobacteria bacterium]|nr:urease accessory protein UreF [Alphaproteobacteria bacterium]